MTQQLKTHILNHVASRTYKPQQTRKLARSLGIGSSDLAAFREAVNQLVHDGQVVLGADHAITISPTDDKFTGTFKKHIRGFGFIIPDDPNRGGDLFIPATKTQGALTGDHVIAEIHYQRPKQYGRTPAKSSLSGSIIEITQRGTTHFVGKLTNHAGIWLVHVDGKVLTEPVIIRDPSIKNATRGSKVAVELTKYPHGNQPAEGVITNVLGRQGEPSAETLAVMFAYDLVEKFPAPVTRQAAKIIKQYEHDQANFLRDRLDLRNQTIITIDPPDAKDYDDAISITTSKNSYELGIHIADVSTFVQPNSQLDTEAHKRANSTYLPRKVIPMLPEVLSNGICSLQADVPRLTKSIFITYDKHANVTSTRIANSIIQSARRLTYLEAQAIIDKDYNLAHKHADDDKKYTPKITKALQQMNDLSKKIRKRRLNDGMIVLDLPEVQLIYDDAGNVIDAQPEDDAYTHKLIEAFMVEANEAVATMFATLNIPLIRRTHPDPATGDNPQLQSFAQIAGHKIPTNPTRKEVQSLLDAVRGKPASRAIHLAVLKTLTKAQYSPALIGHYALAGKHYAHFTSPIRRYADLIVHRQFQALIDALGNNTSLPKSPAKRKKLTQILTNNPRCQPIADLTKTAKHCTDQEQISESAERELRDVLVLQLLEKHIGEQFQGTVTGVTNFGIFVQLDKYLIEGLIKLTDLPGARFNQWSFDDRINAVVAQGTKRSIAIGKQFKVQITKIDVAKREMDLSIVDDTPESKYARARRSKKAGMPEQPTQVKSGKVGRKVKRKKVKRK